LIDELQRSAQAGSDLLQTNHEELKTCIHAKLAPKPKPATQADGEDGLPRVYLLCDREDYDDTKSIEDFLSDHGVVVLPPPIEGDETLISQYHRESLQACDALMIYYGRVGDTWAQLKRLELLKLAGLGRDRPLRAKAFYLSVPTTSQKERFRCPGALVIKNYQGFDPETLESFLAHLKQGSTASP